MLQVLVAISQKFLLQKRDMGLCKRKKSEKNGHKSVQDIENNGYLRCPSRKKKKEIKE
jgi:hypothetical protein